MRRYVCTTCFLTLLLAAIGSAMHAATPPNAVANGDFEQIADGWPVGWTPKDNPNVILQEDAKGNHYLNVARRDGKQRMWAHQSVKVDPAWTTVRVSARMRVQGLKLGDEPWKNARISMRCEDADGKTVGYAPTPQRNEDCDWRLVTAQGDLPKGTHHIAMEPALFGPAGSVDFDDITLIPVGEDTPPLPVPLKPIEPHPLVSLWGQEPVETLSSTRGRVWLNGVWRFMPAVGAAADAPMEGAWGYIPVPGAWADHTWRIHMAKPLAMPAGGCWQDVDLRKLDRAWYERSIHVPAEWADRAILLDVRRLSTDAVVYIDGKRVGEVHWPGGRVDLTGHVRPGSTATLRLFVLATPDEGDVLHFMGTATSQVTRRKAQLDGRGLVGEVALISRPRGAHISDVFVKPSTRRKRVDLDVELTGIPRARTVTITADMRNEKDESEKLFADRAKVVAADTQVLHLGWEWANPRLWDLGRPNLYTLHLTVSDGDGLTDTYAQRFGFREFWIEGTGFFLNGRRARLRPIGGHGGNARGVPELMDRRIDAVMALGFNIAELWPNDHGARGFVHYRDLWCERADEKGFGLTGVALAMNSYMYTPSWKFQWDDPAVKAEWQRKMVAELRQYRNHPSVLMWGTSANFFGTSDDQNPVKIGTHEFAANSDPDPKRLAGREGIALIKEADPTRPVFTHHGSDIGDVHTVNMYLNILPLQDRIEWLSHYHDHGVIPFLPVEFGTPLQPSFLRGRAGYGDAVQTEPLLTEFCAIYFGPQAFADESVDYRKTVADGFREGQQYRSWHGEPRINDSREFQRFLSLFSSWTWRAWRTWGISGGMVPWGDGHGWPARPLDGTEVEMPPFTPGQRGVYFAKVPVDIARPYSPPAEPILPAGKAIVENNGPTLAWIAGFDPESPGRGFTDRMHHVTAGKWVTKQVAVINDTGEQQPYTFTLSLRVNGQEAAAGKGEGRVETAANTLVPVRLKTPEGIARPTDAELILSATVGQARHSDTFALRIYPPDREAGSRGSVAVFDPVGATADMLKRLGYGTSRWMPGTSVDVLVIGRQALATGALDLSSLEDAVRGGMRVLVMVQDPVWLRTHFGLRVGRHLARQVFPIPGSGFGSDLEAVDLANWSGHSTLVDPYPDYSAPDIVRANSGIPYWGWRWGARHVVSSAPVEKPHLAGWRPLLECEFGLMYSPLLELDLGRGRMTLCTLDLEDHVGIDPAAARVARRLLDHVRSAEILPRATTVAYVGDDDAARLLDGLRLRYTRGTSVPENGVLIVGQGAALPDADILRFAEGGGRVLVLPRPDAAGPLGVRRRTVDDIRGAPRPESAPEFSGLSAADLRLRAPHALSVLEAAPDTTITADGLLGRRPVGRGVVIVTQIDPGALEADDKTFLRYTRWHWTRALTQILANLGAEFTSDDLIFTGRGRPVAAVPLAGVWQAQMTVRIANAGQATTPDRGVSPEAAALLRSRKLPDDLVPVEVPGMWEGQVDDWKDTNGEVVYIKRFSLPPELRNRDMIVCLGTVDDRDETWLNGHRIGGTADGVASEWNVPRRYKVPANLLRPQGNVLVVRVWDQFRGGGFGGPKDAIRVEPVDPIDVPDYYHADYRDDFKLGDDPYRYFRW